MFKEGVRYYIEELLTETNQELSSLGNVTLHSVGDNVMWCNTNCYYNTIAPKFSPYEHYQMIYLFQILLVMWHFIPNMVSTIQYSIT